MINRIIFILFVIFTSVFGSKFLNWMYDHTEGADREKVKEAQKVFPKYFILIFIILYIVKYYIL